MSRAAIIRALARRLAQSGERGGARGIRAFHGSPHDFDRFDLSRIGTGEGAQAYGHGLYFAENEGVARGYRDALTTVALDQQTPAAALGRALGVGGGDRAAARETLLSNLRSVTQTETRWPGRYPANADIIKRYEDALRLLDEGASGPGRMYEVRINAKPGDFLDWDVPLSAQPQSVRARLGSVVADRDPILSELIDDFSDPAAAQIAGFFPHSRGSQVYRTLASGNESTASNRLREAGIPGIRFLDQGSRAAGEGSRNYVVFNDSIIDIIRKYGIAGLGVGTGGAIGLREALRERMT